LSHAFWKSEFGGGDVLGRRLRIGNIDGTIIGVAPEGFNGINDAVPPVAFVPTTTFAGNAGTSDATTYFTSYKWGWMHIMARRKPGVSLEAATADATQAFRLSWLAAGPDNPLNDTIEVARPTVALASLRPGNGPDPAIETRTAFWIMVVSGIVLLIACANVANLMLARTLERHRETAVRLALGVSRERLAVQAIVESLVLTTIGGMSALIVVQTGGTLIRGVLMRTPMASSSFLPDSRVLLAAFTLTLIGGVILGLVPGLLLEKGDISRTLRGAVRGGRASDSRIRSGLLIAQAALSVVLLVGAALFVRSLDAVSTMRMGYDVDRVLHVSRVIRGAWPGDEALNAMRDTLVSTARSLPGVESAAWISSAPFISTSNTDLFVEGIESTRALGTFTYQATTADYFKTMGTRVLRGRGLADDDRKEAPGVAVVSESMARILWPGKDAIGQCMRIREENAACTTVVGIAEDMVQREIGGSERYHYYLPLQQFTRTSGNGMVLRLTGDPAREAESIRKALQRVVPGDSYVVTRPLRQIVDDATRSWRMGATMFLAFGSLALIVAAVGLYGAISYQVNGQAREMGVRVALGAQRRDLLRLIVGHAARVGMSGVVAGTLIALAASRWIQPLLFRQSALDPTVYGAVAVTMIAVAVAASAVPALRASNADPNSALRSE
jgi:predicted permease